MEDFRRVSLVLAARKRAAKKNPLGELRAGFLKMRGCIASQVVAPVAPVAPVVPLVPVAVVPVAVVPVVVAPVVVAPVAVASVAVAEVAVELAPAVALPAPVVWPAPSGSGSVPVFRGVAPGPSEDIVPSKEDLAEAGPSGVVAEEVVVLKGLVDSFLIDSVRPSTLKQYKCYWGKFVSFCHRYGWSSLPASEEHVARFCGVPCCADWHQVCCSQCQGGNKLFPQK